MRGELDNALLIYGNYEKTNRYIHEKDRVEGKSFSPRIDGWAHEWICSPGAPSQRHAHNNHFQYYVVLQQADQGSNIQREETITKEAQALKENDMTTQQQHIQCQNNSSSCK